MYFAPIFTKTDAYNAIRNTLSVFRSRIISTKMHRLSPYIDKLSIHIILN